ncbi:conserved Plasmodium protein, unknown function [Plasmodium ovale curtisi]|uniref:Uncharacterized protein n=1 Tax=Plasmodium ovale curtisi TaxID=864141 RepID=A0A1A8VWS0_PLAOA|nr:conserved Plasmodium protein, unknown function [Plasmodium ovale curtisi]SBS92304.1 conserved Plasmodium protein, unknown function [Plasmodium ovale curtisi]
MDAAIVLYVVVRYAAVHYVIGNGKDVSKEKFCVYMRECVASRIRGKYKINEIEKNTIIFDENYEQKHINTFLYNLRGLTKEIHNFLLPERGVQNIAIDMVI